MYLGSKKTVLSLDNNEFNVTKNLENEDENKMEFYTEDEYGHRTRIIGHVFRDTKGPKLICIGFSCE